MKFDPSNLDTKFLSTLKKKHLLFFRVVLPSVLPSAAVGSETSEKERWGRAGPHPQQHMSGLQTGAAWTVPAPPDPGQENQVSLTKYSLDYKSFMSPALAGRFFATNATWEAHS